MRFNNIFAGPSTEVLPQVVEMPVTAAYLPGVIMTLTGTAKFTLAGVATSTQLFVLQENYLAMLDVDDAYQIDENGLGLVPMDEQFFNCRFAASTVLVKGEPVALAANGLLRKVTTTGTYFVVGYMDETVTLPASEELARVRFITPRQIVVP